MSERIERIRHRLALGAPYEEIMASEHILFERLIAIHENAQKATERRRKKCQREQKTTRKGNCIICGNLHIGKEILYSLTELKKSMLERK